jgi:NTE family protein
MEAFGIFKGGGAKGLAHIGALKAAEGREVAFCGVAGTSAGAIVAALVAVGYRADDLYDLSKDPRGRFPKSLLDLLATQNPERDQLWKAARALMNDAAETFGDAGPLKAWFKAPLFYLRNKKILQQLATQWGVFQTSHFETWLGGLLKEKVPGTGADGAVVFEDLKIPLHIIATDLSALSIKVFNKSKTPREPVSRAVAVSMSLPFFFVPKERDPLLVDGGLVSNFPAWVFDAERREKGPAVPTFGFDLIEVEESKPLTSILDVAWRVFNTALDGTRELEVRAVENLYVIPLKVTASLTDFDLDPGDMDTLYNEGLRDAQSFLLREIGPKDPAFMTDQLGLIRESMFSKLRACGATVHHLRVNVTMKTNLGRLRLLYTCGMEDDADDRLEFEVGQGATGRCWELHDFVLGDLEESRKFYQDLWKMNKYQQTMVRSSLKSLLCIPVFDHTQFNTQRPLAENPIVAVLNFDSDDDLLPVFARSDLKQEAAKLANMVSRWLKS